MMQYVPLCDHLLLNSCSPWAFLGMTHVYLVGELPCRCSCVSLSRQFTVHPICQDVGRALSFQSALSREKFVALLFSSLTSQTPFKFIGALPHHVPNKKSEMSGKIKIVEDVKMKCQSHDDQNMNFTFTFSNMIEISSLQPPQKILILIQKIEILIYDLHSIRTTITED